MALIRPVAFVVLLCAPGLAGCAGTLEPRPAPRSPTAAAEGADRPGPGQPATEQDPLAAARAAYFAGVRAWVREDREAARSAFERCRRTCEPASASADELVRREARRLLVKSEYFLGRMAPESPAPAAPSPPERPGGAAASWEVVHGSIRPVRNREVDRWIRYFLGEGREVFQRWLERKARYQPVFDRVFSRHGLPSELIYHAMIESGFSTRAYSWAHAVGIWQFIRSTGRKYGLRSDWWVDERRDPVKSTEAAARYLQDLYGEFGDWELALAAYNVGEMKIRRQMRRQKTRDFWKLRLPRETRNHVPKFYAALLLGSEPERHGFRVPEAAPPASETIRVGFSVDFEVLGRCCGGVDPELLAELNPGLIRGCTPPDEEGYLVRVPAGTGERALDALARLPEEQRVRWAHHRVRRGDTLSEIAERYRTSVRAIAQANRLRSVHRLSVGQDLLIPKGRRAAVAPPRVAAASSGSATRRRVTHVVRRGDTLSEIAERYGTSARQLRRWNRIGRFIYPGQRLTIWVGGSPPPPSGEEERIVRVRKGDTLWDIARRHGVSLSALLRANGLRRSSLIRPGDRIRLPRS